MENLVDGNSQSDFEGAEVPDTRAVNTDDTWIDSEGNLRHLVAPLAPLINFVAGINASVHAKLVGGFFIGSLLLLGLFILSGIVVHRMSRQVNELNRVQAKVDLSRQMDQLLLEKNHFRLMAFLTDDETLNAETIDARTKFRDKIIAFNQISPGSREESELISEISGKLGTIEDRVTTLHEQGVASKALDLYVASEHPVSQKLEGVIEQQVNNSTADMARVITSFRSSQDVFEVLIVTFSLVSLVVVLLVGFVLSWSFIRPVWEINRALARISKGYFDHKVEVSNRDEFGELGANINNMSSQLQKLYGDIEVELAERKRLTEVLEIRSLELASANQELESFSYSVSHDLRAPLRSMDGFGQALLEDYSDSLDSEGQDYLKRICAASQRMGELIDDILTLSRVTRADMKRESVDLSRMAYSVAAELQETEPWRTIEFMCASDVAALGDSHLLRVLVENLIGNAWKYTGKRSNPKIEFGVQIEGDLRVYFVKDNGAGFDMSYVDKLFNPFQRLHSSSDFEGTGIGLATVKRIVSRHGGKVWAESAVDNGAAFYFTLA